MWGVASPRNSVTSTTPAKGSPRARCLRSSRRGRVGTGRMGQTEMDAVRARRPEAAASMGGRLFQCQLVLICAFGLPWTVSGQEDDAARQRVIRELTEDDGLSEACAGIWYDQDASYQREQEISGQIVIFEGVATRVAAVPAEARSTCFFAVETPPLLSRSRVTQADFTRFLNAVVSLVSSFESTTGWADSGDFSRAEMAGELYRLLGGTSRVMEPDWVGLRLRAVGLWDRLASMEPPSGRRSGMRSNLVVPPDVVRGSEAVRAGRSRQLDVRLVLRRSQIVPGRGTYNTHVAAFDLRVDCAAPDVGVAYCRMRGDYWFNEERVAPGSRPVPPPAESIRPGEPLSHRSVNDLCTIRQSGQVFHLTCGNTNREFELDASRVHTIRWMGLPVPTSTCAGVSSNGSTPRCRTLRGGDTEARPPRAEAPASSMQAANGTTSVEDLLNGALGSMRQRSTRDGSGMPLREDVARALRGIARRVRSCGQGTEGVATARITFQSSGRVQRVDVRGVPVEVQSCVARIIRAGALLPPFASSTFTVNFPFRVE